MLLLLAAALPGLFWEGGTDSAPALREAGISHVYVPPSQVESWKKLPGIAAEAADLQSAVKLLPPAVNYRIDEASASRVPWLDSNGWRFLREPGGHFYYDVAGRQAPLAAAEAFCWSANAMIRTDAGGLKPLAEMLGFLRGVSGPEMPALADIGLIDDGSPDVDELMNLLVRGNLLFKIVPLPDRRLKLTVRLGSKEYPHPDTQNLNTLVHQIRAGLTDDKRQVRVYGSPVVIVRLTGSAGHVRLHLLNYAAAARRVQGIRVRVLGRYSKHQVVSFGSPGAELLDYSVDSAATEFTLPELTTYAVIDLSR